MNKKAVMEGLVEKLLWIIFFVALSMGVYYLIKTLTRL